MSKHKDIEVEPGVFVRKGRKVKHLQPIHTLYESNMRDVPKTLRKIAKEIEAGEYGDVAEALLIIDADTMSVHGIGPASSWHSVPVMFGAANHWFYETFWKIKGSKYDQSNSPV